MKRGILVKKKEFLRDLKKGLIGIDEEDKEAINDSIYDLFEDDEGSSLNEQGVVHQMNTNNI